MDDISAAVDKAASASTGSTPATPTAPASTPATAAASSPAAPAAGSGSESTASAKGSADALTTRANEADDELQDADWLKIPVERRQPILDNARKKEAARVRTELLQTYGLPEDAEPRVIQSHINAIMTNPVGYFQWLGQDLQRRGLIQAPTGAPPPPPKPAPTRPQPSLRAEDGTAAYSQADMDALLEFERNELQKTLDARLAPLMHTHQAYQQEQVRSEAHSVAASQIAEAMTWPDFQELRPEIHRLMSQDGRRTLESTYIKLHSDLIKKREASLESTARQKVLAELKTTPDPNTVRPGTPRPAATAKKTNSFDSRIEDAVARAVSEASA